MEAHEKVFDEIRSILSAAASRGAKARRIAEAIRRSRDFRWAGIYEIDGQEIAAIAWTRADPPAFPRFPKTKGLCGEALRLGTAVVVGDVTKDSKYLTTFGSTQSEIVAPIFERAGKIPIGLIDAESERLDAFNDDDRVFLEQCGALVADLWQ